MPLALLTTFHAVTENPIAAAVGAGYDVSGPALELGGLMLDETNLSDVHVEIPLGMLNRLVTQSPTDVPADVLAQLGSRVQHQLRAPTPNDAKALKQTVNTYPTSSYDDLGKVILSLGIGEAIVTVMNERGAPTPVARTRLRAPESLMGPPTRPRWDAAVKASPGWA